MEPRPSLGIVMDSMRVLAPCPFTDADVTALRSMAAHERREHGEAIDDAYTLDSIADRIQSLLPPLPPRIT